MPEHYVYNIVDHGADPAGQSKSTTAFARAMDTASRAGGGRVVVPRGTFLTGPIVLRSHIELHLQEGATILFSRDYTDYPLIATDWEGLPDVRCMSPVWGEDLVNVAITGSGTINGQGEAWRAVKKKKMTAQQWEQLLASGGVLNDAGDVWYPTRNARDGLKIAQDLRQSGRELRPEDFAPAREALRPNMLKLTRCKQVVLDGPTFTNSPAWNVHLLLCQNVTVRNVTVLNPWWSQNGDALDIDACRDVTVEHSLFDAGDDAICIKSGKDEPGRRRGVPCENIAVRNCTVLHGHGGVTIGSEMSGGVRNVTVTNCLFRGTDIGLRFKTTRGRGGVVENVDVSNVAMHDIRHEAISLNMYYFVKDPRPEPVSERTPVFRTFRFRNITADGAARAIELRGLPEMPVENITLENARMRSARGALLSDARDVTLRNLHLQVDEVPAVHAHNVANLMMQNVTATGPFDPPTGHMGDL
ncbi:MAG TPA: glycoside hydrolase family 28 protein [Tepidisphaeraceae bacterium]|nr:glycoside hydrolase family 28 protein [Tepidisphaeraceae bacterium]